MTSEGAVDAPLWRRRRLPALAGGTSSDVPPMRLMSGRTESGSETSLRTERRSARERSMRSASERIEEEVDDDIFCHQESIELDIAIKKGVHTGCMDRLRG